MNFVDQKEGLGRLAASLTPNFLAGLDDPDVEFVVEEMGGQFELTNGEIGELCELVRQVIAKEQPPEGFAARLLQKLDEDNQPKAADIVWALYEKIFAKLLPALGVRVPPEMTVKPKPMPAPVAGSVPAEPPAIAPPERAAPTERPVPLRKIVPPLSAGTPARMQSSPPENLPGAAAGMSVYIKPRPEVPRPGALPDLYPPTVLETPRPNIPTVPVPQTLLDLVKSDKHTPEEIQKRFASLPPSLKQILKSFDAAAAVAAAGKKCGLHIDQTGILGDETGLVLLGFTHPADFVSELKNRLELPEETILAAAKEINMSVLLKIRDALKEVHGEALGGTAPGETPEEHLERAEVLRGIENPERSFPKPSFVTPPALPKPAASKPVRVFGTAIGETPFGSSDSMMNVPKPETPPLGRLAVPNNSSNLVRTPVPPQPPRPPQKPNLIDEKLQGTVTLGKSETHYTIDPYREPAE